jgi:hypothetical protein
VWWTKWQRVWGKTCVPIGFIGSETCMQVQEKKVDGHYGAGL